MEPDAHAALFALGRLYQAYTESPVAEAWAARSRVEATVRILHADGHGIDRERVLRLSHDLPVEGRIDSGNDAQVLQVIALLETRPQAADGTLARDVAETEALLMPGAEGKDPELLLRNLRRWLVAGGRPAVGHIAFVRCLAAAGLTPGPLPALAPSPGASRLSESAWLGSGLIHLAEAADGARRELGALALAVAEWRQRLGPRRRNSRMEVLIQEVASTLVSTPASISRRLGLSLRGASVMLEELAELGIVVEITGRKSWKTFVPSDLTISAPRRSRRQPAPQRTAPLVPSRDLEPLFADTDSAIERAQAAMARLKSRRDAKEARGDESPDEDDPDSA